MYTKLSSKEKNHSPIFNSKDDNLKKKKENNIKKKEERHEIVSNKENGNGKIKGMKKSSNSIVTESASNSINKTVTIENKTQNLKKRNCLSAASSSSFSSTSTSTSNSSNSTSESVKNLSPTQRAVHRKYCETVKLKNQKKQLQEQGQHNNINNLKLFFKDKVIMLNIGTLTGKYFQIEAFWTDTIADLKEIIQDKEGINKESQILIYQGKSLINDNYTLRDYNIQDGATLKLALQMSGGPGAVGNIKKKKICDNVILLLCKKNNELLIFEINPNDDPSQSLIPKKVFQIDNNNLNNNQSSMSKNVKNKCQSNINELENGNKKINYMPHLNNTTINQNKKIFAENDMKPDELNNKLLSPEIVQEIEKRAIASTLQGYNVTLAVQNLDNINENTETLDKKVNYNNTNHDSSTISSSELNMKNEYLDENNHLIQNSSISNDNEFKSEEITISSINPKVIDSLETKIHKHLFLDTVKENRTVYNDSDNGNIINSDNDSLFHNFIHRSSSELGSCSNDSYDAGINFPSRPSSAESDSSLTSLIQECTAAATSFRETINKSQQFLNMYLNSEDNDNNYEPFKYKNKNFSYRESSPNPKKPFSPYLDIQELGTLTISNDFANQTKYNYMPIIPSSIPYDSYNFDLPSPLPSSGLDVNDKSKLSSRPSTAICITPIANNIFPFMVMPKTRPSSAIEISKSTKQYQMVLSNLWVNSKFHKMYLEKNKKNKQSKYNNKNSDEDEVVDEDRNKIDDEEYDQIPNEESSFAILNSSKKKENIYEDYTTNYDIQPVELKDESEIPEIINTGNDINNGDKITSRNNTNSSTSINQSANTKCHTCNKKLGIMSGFKCKCGNIFCSAHRYSDCHNCTYDYKHQGKIQLTKNNPLFKNDKLVRI
ncbi:hypothetical protein LY90DRAFT_670432 [Neocallimastix californiae]|uniref:Ubiquitin-like domain-containing protein n=1 Tax=Neocallimastix californiae TaxID=1754190 RepID=A0A1Y2D0W6_9FUNG|nr:hypothetical protein LY90DRAFT_670432 [Neocallimastix californiae]|eukprot:ORY52774.1 hypothetical protein LY90DRAFT_670432 [Neocallimastix californiae]